MARSTSLVCPCAPGVEHLEADQANVRGDADEPAADEPGDVRAVAVGVRRRDLPQAAADEIVESGDAAFEVRRRVETGIDDGDSDGHDWRWSDCPPPPTAWSRSRSRLVKPFESPNITEGAETVEPGPGRSIGDSPRSSATPSVSKNGARVGAGLLGFRGRRNFRGRPVLPGA